jgi:hypothetical protein
VLEISQRTWYSGTPEPDDFTRSGLGEVLLVTLTEPGAAPQIERCPTGRYSWRHRSLDLGHAADTATIEDQLQALLASLPRPGDTVLRLTLDGALDLAGMAALEAAIERLEPRLRHLETRQDGLVTAASEADLAALAADPLVAEVATALTRSTDPAAPLALRLLHSTWQRLDRA